MFDFEAIKKYLPQYLSDTSQKDLFNELRDFPNNIDKRLYSNALGGENVVFQGDGMRDLPVVNLPDETVFTGPVMILSNTCDTDRSNRRTLTPSLIYCPVVPISSYEEQHRAIGMDSSALDNMITRIRDQKKSITFFLPQTGDLPDDCVALLDHVNSCSVDVLSDDDIPKRRLFSLGDYGFYLFLIKLGIHFTRVRENVDRG